MLFQSIRGTKDILPEDSSAWQHIERVIGETMRLYNYKEIRTPVFEDTAVFARGIGEETDIVGKEMYTFADKGGDSLTLRPEMTAPVMRAWLQHNLGAQSSLTKVYYVAPMFRQERPQAGRQRQFHQYGFESIGLEAPACDAEVIALAAEIYDRLGVGYRLKMNSVGDVESRARYRKALVAFLQTVMDRLTPESQRRSETNPLRVLDSKAEQDREATQNAPHILDHLTDEAAAHFHAVTSMLDGVGVSYEIDHRLVRGLDYYSKTAFEFISADLGAQDALGGGGRYDGLAGQLGSNKEVPAVGFAAGIERLLMVLEKKNYGFPSKKPDCFIIATNDAARAYSFQAALQLRRAGIAVELDFAARSMKAQMREANRLSVRYAVILGEEEMQAREATLRSMEGGEQVRIPFDSLLERIGVLAAAKTAANEGYEGEHKAGEHL